MVGGPGWWTQASGGSQITTSAAHGQTADFTRYARWTGNSNTVAFNTQGGSTTNTISWTTGSSLTLPAAPTRSGYSFSGWGRTSGDWTLVYQTSNPTRSGNDIVYASGYGKCDWQR